MDITLAVALVVVTLTVPRPLLHMGVMVEVVMALQLLLVTVHQELQIQEEAVEVVSGKHLAAVMAVQVLLLFGIKYNIGEY